MAEKKRDMSFEEAMKKLEEAAVALKQGEITLEQALRCYEEGIAYYEQCDTILKNARQKISIYGKEQEDNA